MKLLKKVIKLNNKIKKLLFTQKINNWLIYTNNNKTYNFVQTNLCMKKIKSFNVILWQFNA